MSKQNNKKTPKVLAELLFKPEPYLPGFLLIGVIHNGDEIAATVVSKVAWADPVQRRCMMAAIAEHLRPQLKKQKEGKRDDQE